MNGLETLAREAGADDLFVFRRVAKDRFVNVDGHGRGSGWAGNVALDPSCEPFFTTVTEHGLARADSGLPTRLFGPYWNATASAVKVGDALVVLGGGDTATMDEPLLRSVGERAAALVEEVPVAKRLADELEATQAALAVASLRPTTLEEAGREIAARAADALSCEFGAVVVLDDEPQLALRPEGWRPTATTDEVIASVLALRGAVTRGMYVEQDLATSPFAFAPLSRADGLVARLSVPVGDAERPDALLVVAHAGTAPRGFTSLCQTVAGKVAEAAHTVLAAFGPVAPTR